MKGIVFTIFNRMIEEKFGLGTWDEMINETHPKSHGIYTSGDTYEAQELFSFVKYLSEKTQSHSNNLVFYFGEYMLSQLAKKYPTFFKDKSFKEFLMSIDKTIHVEVRKIYPDANLPQFNYEDNGEKDFVLLYNSPSKLCSLAEGLIHGASKVYSVNYLLNHSKCLHRDNDCCRLEIKILE